MLIKTRNFDHTTHILNYIWTDLPYSSNILVCYNSPFLLQSKSAGSLSVPMNNEAFSRGQSLFLQPWNILPINVQYKFSISLITFSKSGLITNCLNTFLIGKGADKGKKILSFGIQREFWMFWCCPPFLLYPSRPASTHPVLTFNSILFV